MKIVAGASTIDATPMQNGTVSYNGQIVESMSLIMDGAFTQEQIDDLVNNSWQEYAQDDTPMALVEGYTTLLQSTLVFLRIPDIMKENKALRAELTALQEAMAKLQGGQ